MARTPALPNTAAPGNATTNGSTPQPPESAAASTSASGKQSAATVNFSATTETIPANTPADNNDDQQEPPFELYKSSRLKGYITLILASIINFMAARSSGETVSSTNVVSSTESQRAYAEAAGLTSFLVCFFTFWAHLDRWSPLNRIWVLVFKDGSKLELLLIVFIVIWWTVATAVQTTVKGIAGDGKGQYNLYYSTWGCCWTAYWTLEKWLVAYGWASFKAFISSWPFRAPGWIAICGFSFMTLMWYLDLFSNHEVAATENSALDRHFDEVKLGQWQWLIFVGAITLFPSMLFVVIELFRETSAEEHQANEIGNHKGGGSIMGDISGRMSFAVTGSTSQGAFSPGRPGLSPMRSSRQLTPQRSNPLPEKAMSTGGKPQYENILEGFCLALLVCLWIPTVIVATTPGGGASLVGNAYFFTWVTTIFVMETFIWFVHDLRKGVHSALQVKEREYHKRQQEVLEKSRALEGKRALRLGGGVYADSEDDDMVVDESVMWHMRPALPAHVVPQPQQPLHNHPVFDLPDDDGTHTNDSQGHEEPTPIVTNVHAARQPRTRGRRFRGTNDDDSENGDNDSPEGPPYFSRSDAGSPAASSLFFDTQMSVEEQEDEKHIDPIG